MDQITQFLASTKKMQEEKLNAMIKAASIANGMSRGQLVKEAGMRKTAGLLPGALMRMVRGVMGKLGKDPKPLIMGGGLGRVGLNKAKTVKSGYLGAGLKQLGGVARGRKYNWGSGTYNSAKMPRADILRGMKNNVVESYKGGKGVMSGIKNVIKENPGVTLAGGATAAGLGYGGYKLLKPKREDVTINNY